MRGDPTTIERRLRDELAGHGLLRDEEFAGELYRALANRVWRGPGEPAGAALSWSRAEALVNDLRATAGEQPLALAQTGGEGELSERVRDELGRRGLESEPLDTDTADERHEGAVEESPPPRGTGEAQAPSEPPQAWRDAHAEAAENARRR